VLELGIVNNIYPTIFLEVFVIDGSFVIFSRGISKRISNLSPEFNSDTATTFVSEFLYILIDEQMVNGYGDNLASILLVTYDEIHPSPAVANTPQSNVK